MTVSLYCYTAHILTFTSQIEDTSYTIYTKKKHILQWNLCAIGVLNLWEGITNSRWQEEGLVKAKREDTIGYNSTKDTALDIEAMWNY